MSKTEKERRVWRKLHNEKHHDMYFSLNIFAGEILSRMKRGGGCSVCGGEWQLLQCGEMWGKDINGETRTKLRR